MVSRLFQEQFDCPEGARVIVRYPNRKFYDTHTSSYVTMAQMQAMVTQGDRLQIYARDKDARDKCRCITTQALCQIIAQASRSGASINKEALVRILKSLPQNALGRV